MQASPHLAIVMSRPAFLWEYAIRFRTASDTHKLGPEFVKTEQENLSRWREIQSGNRKTPSLPGLAQGQQKEPAPVGGAPSVRDDVDDATESMQGLRFRDMDVEDDGLVKENPISTQPPAPLAPAVLPTQPGPPPPPPLIQTAPRQSTVYVSLPNRAPTVLAKSLAPLEQTESKKLAPGKRKLPDETEPQPEETIKRPRTVHLLSRPNLVKCVRCSRLGLTCIPRQPGKPSTHQKAMTACAECARLKYGCKFPVFADAQEDVVKVKLPKPNKPPSKRAPRVKKSASEVDTSADERSTEDVKPQAVKFKARASVDRDRPHSGRPLSKAIEKAKAALSTVPRLSSAQKSTSGKQVAFATPEVYKNISSAGMEAVMRVEEEDRREREEEAIKRQSDLHMDDEAEQVDEAEQAVQPEEGEIDEALLLQTDEYHRQEAAQQLALQEAPTRNGESKVNFCMNITDNDPESRLPKLPLRPLSMMPPPPRPLRALAPLPVRPAPTGGTAKATSSWWTDQAAVSSGQALAFAGSGATYRTIAQRAPPPSPPPVPQVLEDIGTKINDAAHVLENSVAKLIEEMSQDLQGRLDAMERRHRDEVEASERKQKAQWSVMADYFNRLEERVGLIEDYVKETSKEFIESHVVQYHKIYAMDSRHALRHDVAFNTLFRHMQGNEGVFDRWSNRLSRIEAALKLPVGTFEEYNPLRSGEYEQAVAIASSVAAETGEDELWDRLQAAHDRFDVLKGKLREATPTPQALRGNTPTPQPGPSQFPGNYRTPSPDRMSVGGGNNPVKDDLPATPRDDEADSDEVEFVGGLRESPRKQQDDEDVDVVNPPALPSKGEPVGASGDIIMVDSDVPGRPAAGAALHAPAPGQLSAPPWRLPQAEPVPEEEATPAWPAPPAWPDVWPASNPQPAPLEGSVAATSPNVGLLPAAPHTAAAPPAACHPAPVSPPTAGAPLVPPGVPPRTEPATPTGQPPTPATPASPAAAHATPAAPEVPQTSAAEPPAPPSEVATISPPLPPPSVKVIPPTPQNSQPESGAVMPVERTTSPPALPARGGREVEATRILSEMWGADNSLMPPGPPATRTRGRSRANSTQPGMQNPMAGDSGAKSAAQHNIRRTSRSPAPVKQNSSARPNPPA